MGVLLCYCCGREPGSKDLFVLVEYFAVDISRCNAGACMSYPAAAAATVQAVLEAKTVNHSLLFLSS